MAVVPLRPARRAPPASNLRPAPADRVLADAARPRLSLHLPCDVAPDSLWAHAHWQGGNRWRWLHDAPQAWKAQFAALDAARDHINLLCPTLDADGPGQALVSRLAAKARQGVKVHLLFDAEHGWPAHRAAWRVLSDAGVHLCRRPATVARRRWSRQPLPAAQAQWLIVDGRQAVVGDHGGALDPRDGDPRAATGRLRPSRLQQAVLAGPAVALLQSRFIAEWEAASGTRPYLARFFPTPLARGDGAVALADTDTPEAALCTALDGARRSVLVAAARWQPVPALEQATEAALQRGLEVRLLLPGDDEGRLSRPWRLPSGVRVHVTTRRRWPGELACVDGRWALLGETGTAAGADDGLHRLPPLLLADAEAAGQMNVQLRADLQRARALPARRSWFGGWWQRCVG